MRIIQKSENQENFIQEKLIILFCDSSEINLFKFEKYWLHEPEIQEKLVAPSIQENKISESYFQIQFKREEFQSSQLLIIDSATLWF